MTKEEQLKRIRASLLSDPENSNRLIAAELRAGDKLVAAVRKELESSAQISVVSHLRGLDGKMRKSRRSSTAVRTHPNGS